MNIFIFINKKYSINKIINIICQLEHKNIYNNNVK